VISVRSRRRGGFLAASQRSVRSASARSPRLCQSIYDAIYKRLDAS
jgi:hypothetical protein